MKNDDDSKVEFEPTPEFLAEFERQAKREGLEGVYRYAGARVPMVERAGGRSDAAYSEELVQDALGDTVMGVVRWDPEKRTLAQHLMRTIRGRTKNEALRLRHFQHRALIDRDDEEASDVEPVAEEAAFIVEDPRPATPFQRAIAAEVIAELRKRAADDSGVLKMIAAFEEGASSREEVMRMTGMSAATYRNVRRRLATLVAKLPTTLRLAAREAMA